MMTLDPVAITSRPVVTSVTSGDVFPVVASGVTSQIDADNMPGAAMLTVDETTASRTDLFGGSAATITATLRIEGVVSLPILVNSMTTTYQIHGYAVDVSIDVVSVVGDPTGAYLTLPAGYGAAFDAAGLLPAPAPDDALGPFDYDTLAFGFIAGVEWFGRVRGNGVRDSDGTANDLAGLAADDLIRCSLGATSFQLLYT